VLEGSSLINTNELKSLKDRNAPTIPEVLDYINKNGLKIGVGTGKVVPLQVGDNWLIQQEGYGSYEALVFRSLKTGIFTTDSRYAMYKARFVDL
jgi:hypothetical protein